MPARVAVSEILPHPVRTHAVTRPEEHELIEQRQEFSLVEAGGVVHMPEFESILVIQDEIPKQRSDQLRTTPPPVWAARLGVECADQVG